MRQRTLLNLGSDFHVPDEQWKPLTQRIEQIVLGQHDLLLPFPPEVEREAQNIAASLLNKYAGSDLLLSPQKGQAGAQADLCAPEHNPQDQADGHHLRSVDLNSLELMNSRSVGGEAVALSALSRVKLDGKLRALGFNTKQISAAIGNIIGRMVQPGSELSTHQWLQERSALGELLASDYAQQSLSALYRASDLLWKHHDEVESFVYRQHGALFHVQETITLFDLTNTFFEGTGKYNDHAAYGHSKEKRSDCPLVTLALVLDGSGFSRRSRIFPGNVSEPGTLQQMIEHLRTPTDPEQSQDTEETASVEGVQALSQQALDLRSPPTIVMDAGIATQENVAWLQEQGYPYIVVSRKNHLEFDEDKAVVVKAGENDAVRAMRIERDDGEIELYCHSERREAKERAINERFLSRFEQELEHLAHGLDKPHRLKSAQKVCEKIGRLRQKYARAAKDYEITTEHDQSGKKAIALHYRRIEREQDPDAHPGVYCLRSNQSEWDETQLWHTYTMLTDLEAVFRSLKSELGMRPVYHQKTRRVEGHIFITLLAYNLVHQIRLTLKAKGIDDSWETIRTTLSTQMRTTVSVRGEDGERIHIRKSNYPSASQQVLLRALELPWNPGKIQKTVVAP
ncbi:MAG: IS1634 family transposase [Gammaproteobacteria bacterium]|nr:IS1634 family transposase [Gammaproteobacteria bacterium]